MKIFQKFAALLVMAFVAVCPAQAEIDEDDLLRYTSSATGLTFHVPANIREKQDKIDGVMLVTPDQQFTVSAIPFDISEVDEDEIADALITLAKAAKIDLTNSKSIKGKTKTIDYRGEFTVYDNAGAAVVVIANVKDTELCYFVTIVAGPDYVEFADEALESLGFNPEAIED